MVNLCTSHCYFHQLIVCFRSMDHLPHPQGYWDLLEVYSELGSLCTTRLHGDVQSCQACWSLQTWTFWCDLFTCLNYLWIFPRLDQAICIVHSTNGMLSRSKFPLTVQLINIVSRHHGAVGLMVTQTTTIAWLHELDAARALPYHLAITLAWSDIMMRRDLLPLVAYLLRKRNFHDHQSIASNRMMLLTIHLMTMSPFVGTILATSERIMIRTLLLFPLRSLLWLKVSLLDASAALLQWIDPSTGRLEHYFLFLRARFYESTINCILFLSQSLFRYERDMCYFMAELRMWFRSM